MKLAMTLHIQGLDKFVIGELSSQLQEPLSLLTKIPSEAMLFIGHDSFVYHQGVDQHAWQTFVQITLLPSLKSLQTQIIECLIRYLKPHTIHVHFQFQYVDATEFISVIQPDYPLFVTETNSVDVVVPPEEDSKEIYHGNIFADKEELLHALDKGQSSTASTKKKKA
jgi:hypothetical protein